eukprot:4614608-Amphidinium_carterae.1
MEVDSEIPRPFSKGAKPGKWSFDGVWIEANAKPKSPSPPPPLPVLEISSLGTDAGNQVRPVPADQTSGEWTPVGPEANASVELNHRFWTAREPRCTVLFRLQPRRR